MNIKSGNNKATSKNILIVFSGLFCLFLTLRILSNLYLLNDSDEYLKTAASIVDGSYFIPVSDVSDAAFVNKRPFIYPLFLSFFLDYNLILIAIVQSIFGIFSIFMMLKILKKLKIELSWWLVVFFVFTPSFFIYHQLIMSDWLVALLLLVLCNVLLSDWNNKNFCIIQMITITLALTKPVFYPFVYFNFLYFLIYFIRIQKFHPMLFFPIIVLSAYLYFNAYKTGSPQFSSIQNTNLIEYNLYYFKSFSESEPEANIWLTNVKNGADAHLSIVEKNNYYSQVAKSEILDNFVPYSCYHLFTAIRGIFDPGRFDLMTFYKKDDTQNGFLKMLNSGKPISEISKNPYFYIYLLLIPILVCQILKIVFSITYLYLQRKKVNYKNSYLIILILYCIAVTGPVNSSRYMMPLQGFLILAALGGIQTLKLYWANRSVLSNKPSR